MTEDQREISRKKRVIEYAEKIGHVGRACRHFGIAIRRRGCPHNYRNKTPDDMVEKILATRHVAPKGILARDLEGLPHKLGRNLRLY